MNTPRHTATEEAYHAFKQERKGKPELLETFNFAHETVLHEFEYWIIIKNRFPYDRMARTNDMLVSKRPLQSVFDGTPAEQKEYQTIIQNLAQENFYDAYMENFPKIKSVKRYVHIHLIRWHNSK